MEMSSALMTRSTVAQIIGGQIYSAAHLQETQMGGN